jgi:hypothetical protein
MSKKILAKCMNECVVWHIFKELKVLVYQKE